MKFKTNDRIKWRITETVIGTGTVLGKGMDIGLQALGVVELYIIELDKPLEGLDVRAILVPAAALLPVKEGE